jgi:hypothetical protein
MSEHAPLRSAASAASRAFARASAIMRRAEGCRRRRVVPSAEPSDLGQIRPSPALEALPARNELLDIAVCNRQPRHGPQLSRSAAAL